MKERRDDLAPEEQELLGSASLEVLRARHADCPQAEILLASQAGVLPADVSRAVAKHAETCAFCQVLLKELARDQFSDASAEEARRVRDRVLSAVAGQELKARKAAGGSSGSWWWKAVPVAVLSAAMVLFLVWIRLRSTSESASVPSSTVQQAPKQAAQSVLVWEKLPIKLQVGSLLITRGPRKAKQEQYAAALTSALSFYRDGDYADAEKKLRMVAQQFPQGVEGQLYLGITQLKLNENAIEALRAAQTLGPEQFRDDATWYLALAYRRAGDVKDAVAELKKLCEGNTKAYSERACTGVRELLGNGQ